MALVEDGDLFALATSLASLLQAPVTIEDARPEWERPRTATEHALAGVWCWRRDWPA